MKTRRGCILVVTLTVVMLVITPPKGTRAANEAGEQLDEEASGGGGESVDAKLPRKIDKNTFLNAVSEPEIGSLVMFYAPWCGHCKRMVSTWSQLARKHNPVGKFLIAKVDCAEQTELCSDNDVLGYPTFLYFKKHSPSGVFYDGKRDMDSIDGYLYENYIQHDPNAELSEAELGAEPPVYELDEKTFDVFVSKGFHFVKFYAPWCGHCQRLAPIWEELGEKYYNTIVRVSKVDCTKNGAVCERYDVRGYPTLLFFHEGKMVRQYDRARSLDDMSNFIEDLVEIYDPSAFADEQQQQQQQPPPDYHQSTEAAGVGQHGLPTLKLVDMPGELAQLDDDTFAKFVSRKGVTFVKFYAPWCSHCQAMAETWKELASKLRGHESVRIADVDCTRSVELCMNQNIEGYPTLILFSNGNRVNNYQNDRSLESLEHFVLSYVHHDDL